MHLPPLQGTARPGDGAFAHFPCTCESRSNKEFWFTGCWTHTFLNAAHTLLGIFHSYPHQFIHLAAPAVQTPYPGGGGTPAPLPAASTHISQLTHSHTTSRGRAGPPIQAAWPGDESPNTSPVSNCRQHTAQAKNREQLPCGVPLGTHHLSGTCGHSLGRINVSLEMTGMGRSLEVTL